METPIGRLWVAASAHGLLRISRGDLPEPDLAGAAELDPHALGPALVELRAYFAGRLRTFSLALDLEEIGPFDAAVWLAACEVGYGETASYGELAAMAGYPRAPPPVGGPVAG